MSYNTVHLWPIPGLVSWGCSEQTKSQNCKEKKPCRADGGWSTGWVHSHHNNNQPYLQTPLSYRHPANGQAILYLPWQKSGVRVTFLWQCLKRERRKCNLEQWSFRAQTEALFLFMNTRQSWYSLVTHFIRVHESSLQIVRIQRCSVRSA